MTMAVVLMIVARGIVVAMVIAAEAAEMMMAEETRCYSDCHGDGGVMATFSSSIMKPSLRDTHIGRI